MTTLIRRKFGVTQECSEEFWLHEHDLVVRYMVDQLVAEVRDKTGVTVKPFEVVFAPAEPRVVPWFETWLQRTIRRVRRRPAPWRRIYTVRAHVIVSVPEFYVPEVV